MNICIAYRRVSTAQQGKSGLGLDAQMKTIDDYASRNNLRVKQWCQDEDSGANESRTGLMNALALCEQFGCPLLVAKLDRLSRDAAHILQLMKNYKIIDAGNGMKSEDSDNEFMMTIDAGFAQRERKKISERTKAALAAAKARGVQLGNPKWRNGQWDGKPGTKQSIATARAVWNKMRAQSKALKEEQL